MNFKAVLAFVFFWIGIFIIGGFYMIIDQGAVNDVVNDYWVEGRSVYSLDYFEVMRIGWSGLPLILFFVVIILTLVTVAYSRHKGAVY